LMDGVTWVRLDGPMLVLGESHGDPKAPSIINATGIRKYRYEGWATHAEERLEKSPQLGETLDAVSAQREERIGLERPDGDTEDHSAEDAFPKYARTLADASDMVAKQGARGTLAGKSMVAGTDLGEGYSLPKALIDGMWSAFSYAKSWNTKFFG